MSEDEEARKRLAISDYLKARGFEAGEPVHEMRYESGVDGLKEALFGWETATLFCSINGEAANIWIFVESIEKDWQLDKNNPLGCRLRAGWRIFGHLLNAPQEGARVRVYLIADIDPNDSTEGFIQRVPDDPDPDGIVEAVDFPYRLDD